MFNLSLKLVIPTSGSASRSASRRSESTYPIGYEPLVDFNVTLDGSGVLGANHGFPVASAAGLHLASGQSRNASFNAGLNPGYEPALADFLSKAAHHFMADYRARENWETHANSAFEPGPPLARTATAVGSKKKKSGKNVDPRRSCPKKARLRNKRARKAYLKNALDELDEDFDRAFMAVDDTANTKLKKLTTENYSTWKVYMKAYLKKKLLWDAMNLSESEIPIRPAPLAATPAPTADETLAYNDALALYNEYITKEEDAQNEIILNVTESQLIHVENVTTGRAAWAALASWHETKSRSSRHSALREFFSTTYKGPDMETHLNLILTTSRYLVSNSKMTWSSLLFSILFRNNTHRSFSLWKPSLTPISSLTPLWNECCKLPRNSCLPMRRFKLVKKIASVSIATRWVTLHPIALTANSKSHAKTTLGKTRKSKMDDLAKTNSNLAKTMASWQSMAMSFFMIKTGFLIQVQPNIGAIIGSSSRPSLRFKFQFDFRLPMETIWKRQLWEQCRSLCQIRRSLCKMFIMCHQ